MSMHEQHYIFFTKTKEKLYMKQQWTNKKLENRYIIRKRLNFHGGEYVQSYEGYDCQALRKSFIKIINHDNILERIRERSERKKFYEKERKFNQIMTQCRSPYICSISSTISNDDNSIYVLEPLEQHTLDSELFSANYFFESEALIIMMQLAEGLKAVWSRGYIWQSLSLRNVGLYEGRYKLGSFQNLKQQEKLQYYDMIEACVAPQILRNQPFNEKVDIWSLGVMFFFMLNRSRYNQKVISLHQFLKNHKIEYCSPKTKKLLSRMLKQKIEQRITLKQLWIELRDIQKSVRNEPHYTIPQKLLIIPQSESQILDNSYSSPSPVSYSSSQIPVEMVDDQELEKIREEKPDEYSFYDQLYFQIVKNQYLHSQLLMKGNINVKSLSLSERQIVFMITSRIFTNLCNLKKKIRKNSSEIKTSFLQTFQFFYQFIKENFNEASSKLAKKQDESLQIVKRRWKLMGQIFSDKLTKTKERQKFLNGIEGHDYNQNEQIIMTVEMIRQTPSFREKVENRNIINAYPYILKVSLEETCTIPFRFFIQKQLNQVTSK